MATPKTNHYITTSDNVKLAFKAPDVYNASGIEDITGVKKVTSADSGLKPGGSALNLASAGRIVFLQVRVEIVAKATGVKQKTRNIRIPVDANKADDAIAILPTKTLKNVTFSAAAPPAAGYKILSAVVRRRAHLG